MNILCLPSAFGVKTVSVPALLACGLVLALGLFAAPAHAQDLPVYTDSLQNGFNNWSWASTNAANTAPVQAGSDSIAVTYTAAWQGLYLHGGPINTTYYTALSFWINGGPTGGQQFGVHKCDTNGLSVQSVPITNYVAGGAIPANTWVQVIVPLADIQAANIADFDGFSFQDTTGGTQPVYYVDTISLVAVTVPTTVHVSVNAAQAVQTIDNRDFGVNTAIYDTHLGSTNTQTLMTAAGARAFRYPGGSESDQYDWTVLQYTGQSTTSTFGTLTDALGPQAVITTNYGTGSPQMSAAWVAYCNASPSSTVNIGLDSAGRDWKTASYWAALRGATPLATDDGLNFLRVNHATPYGYKNWEIGNECYGFWETDNHSAKQDPVIYANTAQATTALMKQVDPTIQTGVVVTSTEDDSGNQTETVTNPVTGVQHKGWTAVLLSTLHSLNYVPDFVIIHNYPVGSDEVLLQSWPWTGIASSVRTMLTDYMGAPATANVQLLATENNTGTSGKQGVSLIDGLYYAESFGGLIQTEFKGMLWWDLRNSIFTTGDDSPSYYGWRIYSDNGMLASGDGGTLPGSALDTPYPAYFALKLVSKFASGGDTVVPVTSDYPFLTAFATKRANGGLSLLVVNTNSSATVNTQFSLSGYAPAATATTYQYGEAEDTRQSMGATVDLTQGSLSGIAPTFSTTFPPYSMTVINLAPAPPAPTITSFTPTSGPVGTVTTLTGTGLSGVSAVRFHNSSATVFSANAAGTQLTVTVPKGAATGTITVTTPGGSVKTATNFTVISPPTITSFTPISGPVGTVVTLTGTNFGGVSAVRFHNANAKTFSANAGGTQLTVTVPSGAGTGTITVTTPGGSVKTATSFTVH